MHDVHQAQARSTMSAPNDVTTYQQEALNATLPSITVLQSEPTRIRLAQYSTAHQPSSVQ